MITRSGQNVYHGSLYEYNRNRALTAKDFFATSQPKPQFNRNEFGGTFNGPIIKSRMFSSEAMKVCASARGARRTSMFHLPRCGEETLAARESAIHYPA